MILTGGADMQLKIWSAETGQCAATLVGHKAGVFHVMVNDYVVLYNQMSRLVKSEIQFNL